MEGVDEMERRAIGIGMTDPRTNALEILRVVYDAPPPSEVLEAFTTEIM